MGCGSWCGNDAINLSRTGRGLVNFSVVDDRGCTVTFSFCLLNNVDQEFGGCERPRCFTVALRKYASLEVTRVVMTLLLACLLSEL